MNIEQNLKVAEERLSLAKLREKRLRPNNSYRYELRRAIRFYEREVERLKGELAARS